MAVIVVGDIDPADAEKKIKAHFGKFKNPANATRKTCYYSYETTDCTRSNGSNR